MKICFIILFSLFFYFSYAQDVGYEKGEIIVQYANNDAVNNINDLAFLRNNNIVLQSAQCLSPPLSIWRLKFDENANEKTLLNALRHNPNILSAQFNYYVKLRESVPPNDPQFVNQWYLQNIGQNGGTAGADIQAVKAWDITQGGVTTDGDTIVVAIIDDGTSLSHPDLKNNRWYNYKEIPQNGIDDDLNGYEDDFQGWNVRFKNDDISNGAHGVGIEGIIGATGNNGQGVTGINWRVKMMHIKAAFDADNILTSDIIEAYNYILNMRLLYNQTGGKKGAFIVASNSSFGRDGEFPSDQPIWCGLYDALGKAGVLNISAATNANVNVDEVGDIPSTCESPYLLVVTSSDRKDLYGGFGYGVKSVDISAPGVDIFTTKPNNQYGFENGNSDACPIVVGIVALAYATPCPDFVNFTKNNPSAAALTLKDWILKSGVPLPAFQGKTLTSARVNAYNTLNNVSNFCGACFQPSKIHVLKDTNSLEFLMETISIVDTINFRYRKKGETDWIVQKERFEPYILKDLEKCTEYECEILTNCKNLQSSPAKFLLKTDGCCTAPEDINVAQVGEGSIFLTASKVIAADAYQIAVNDNGNINVLNFEDTNFTINNLKTCQNYTISIQSVCKESGVSASRQNVKLRTKGCGACTEKPYCLFSGDTRLEWIDSVIVGSFKTKTGNNGGYFRYDSVVTTLIPNKKYPLSIKANYAFIDYQENARIWIDYNSDGDFADAGELIWDKLKFIGTARDSFTTPANFTEGITRMRVVLKNSVNGNPPPQLCESFKGGEVEDFCIKLSKTLPVIYLDDNSIKISPNPASDFLIIKNEIPGNAILKCQLYTLDGRLILNKILNSQNDEIILTDFPPLSNSMYFLKIETEKGVIVKKIVTF